MNAILIQYEHKEFTIKENIKDYLSLVKTIIQLFHLENVVKDDTVINLCYLDSNGNDKIEISSEDDYQEVIRYHIKDGKSSIMTLEMKIAQKNDNNSGIDIDEMLKSLKISESCTFSNKNDNKPSHTIPENSQPVVPEIKIQNNQSILPENIISRIDEIISSKMKVMEDKMKKLLDDQTANITLSKRAEGANAKFEISNLKPMTADNICIETKQQIVENTELLSTQEICTNCHASIKQNKFICIICDNSAFCSTCEGKHGQHPLLKVNISAKMKSISSKEELARYFSTSKAVIASSDLKQNNSFLYISLSTFECFPFLAISSNGVGKIKIQISNESNKQIDNKIVLYSKLPSSLSILPVIVLGLQPRESKIFEVKIKVPDVIGPYEIEFYAYAFKGKVIYEPLKIFINVVNERDVEEANANFLLAESDELMKLPKNKKMVLYQTVVNGLTTKSIEEIYKILVKYDFIIANALDELTA